MKKHLIDGVLVLVLVGCGVYTGHIFTEKHYQDKIAAMVPRIQQIIDYVGQQAFIAGFEQGENTCHRDI